MKLLQQAMRKHSLEPDILGELCVTVWLIFTKSLKMRAAAKEYFEECLKEAVQNHPLDTKVVDYATRSLKLMQWW